MSFTPQPDPPQIRFLRYVPFKDPSAGLKMIGGAHVVQDGATQGTILALVGLNELTAPITGAGHAVGVWGKILSDNTAVVAPLVIGGEGTLELKQGAATIVVGLEAQLAELAASFSVGQQFIGLNSHIVKIAAGATLPVYVAVQSSIDQNDGTIGVYQWLKASPPASNGGSIGAIALFTIENFSTTPNMPATMYGWTINDPKMVHRRVAGGNALGQYVEFSGGQLFQDSTVRQSAGGGLQAFDIFSIAPNLLNITGSRLEIKLFGECANNVNNKQIGAQFGAVATPDSYLPAAVAAQNVGFGINIEVIRTAANAQVIMFSSFMGSTWQAAKTIVGAHAESGSWTVRLLVDAAANDLTYRFGYARMFFPPL